MDKKGFKVGDKVRLKNPKQFRFGSAILTITRTFDKYQYLYITYKGIEKRHYSYFPLKPCEVEKIRVEGEQLLFSFFKEIRNGY